MMDRSTSDAHRSMQRSMGAIHPCPGAQFWLEIFKNRVISPYTRVNMRIGAWVRPDKGVVLGAWVRPDEGEELGHIELRSR